MKLTLENLLKQLGRPLAPIYGVVGDEPLQFFEALDELRRAARRQGYHEREVYEVDHHFEWEPFLVNSQLGSLFASRTLLELRLQQPPDATALNALSRYAAHPPEDKRLILSYEIPEGQASKVAKWLPKIEAWAVVVQSPKVPLQRLPQWLTARAKRHELVLSDPAAVLLGELTEGNLLAADQELQKLRMLHPAGTVLEPSHFTALQQSSRYTLFLLLEAMLNGEGARALRMVEGLQAEGVVLPQMLWLLEREVTALQQLAAAQQRGESLEPHFERLKIWSSQQPLFVKAVRRRPLPFWQQAVVRVAAIDRWSKSEAVDRAWLELQQLILELA